MVKKIKEIDNSTQKGVLSKKICKDDKISQPIDEDLVHLNIRNKYFPSVSRNLLTSVPDSALEAMFSERHDLTLLDGKVFIDRHPKMIKKLLKYLQNDRMHHEYDK